MQGARILDDGEFYVDLNCNYQAADAPGFLERRALNGPATPFGVECLGSFERTAGGAWRARVNDAPTVQGDSRDVYAGTSRMDAITALWRARHSAYRRSY